MKMIILSLTTIVKFIFEC